MNEDLACLGRAKENQVGQGQRAEGDYPAEGAGREGREGGLGHGGSMSEASDLGRSSAGFLEVQKG